MEHSWKYIQNTEGLNKCTYDKSLRSLGFLLSGRVAMSPLTLWFCRYWDLNKGAIRQSWRASPSFLCCRKIWKELRDRCEEGQSKLKSHLLQVASALLSKLGIPSLCSINLHYNLLWSTTYFSVFPLYTVYFLRAEITSQLASPYPKCFVFRLKQIKDYLL